MKHRILELKKKLKHMNKLNKTMATLSGRHEAHNVKNARMFKTHKMLSSSYKLNRQRFLELRAETSELILRGLFKNVQNVQRSYLIFLKISAYALKNIEYVFLWLPEH